MVIAQNAVMHTLEDLEAARAELSQCIDAFDNPRTSFREQLAARIREASRKVHDIESELRSRGLITLDPKRTLEAELDMRFPTAQHREIVEYQGRRYRRRFFPEQKCRSGWAVKKWGRCWEEVEG